MTTTISQKPQSTIATCLRKTEKTKINNILAPAVMRGLLFMPTLCKGRGTACGGGVVKSTCLAIEGPLRFTLVQHLPLHKGGKRENKKYYDTLRRQKPPPPLQPPPPRAHERGFCFVYLFFLCFCFGLGGGFGFRFCFCFCFPLLYPSYSPSLLLPL